METTLHSLAGSQAVIAWIFIIIGILAIGFALFFLLIIKYALFKGLALVLLLAGILQLDYGILTLSAFPNMSTVVHRNDSPTDKEEVYINEKIHYIGSFTWIALAGAATGMLLFITFRRSVQTFWKGIGLGMIIQGLLTAALFQAESIELKSCKASVTQAIAFQDKCRKKINE